MAGIPVARLKRSEPAIKVLHFIPSFGPGGAERQLALVAPALARDGVEVHVAYVTGGPNLARFDGTDVRLHALPAASNHDPMLAWRIVRLVRRVHPDVVQTWLTQMDVLAGGAALLCGVPLIVSERSSAAAYAPGWKTRLRLRIGRRAAGVVANSRGGIDYWAPHVPADRLHLVRNCVTADDANEAREIDPDDPLASFVGGRPLVLFAGRFSYEKNIPALVDALVLVARERPDVAIVMFGDGPERDAAAQRIAAAGMVDRIALPGYSPRLQAWMAGAAACVSVSHFEGHPNVVIEAASVGCPLVLSDIPAHRELFDERAVTFVPTDSPSAIARGVLESLHNPAAARERAAHARTIAAQHDLPATVASYRTLYEQVLVRARRTPSPT